MIAASDPSWSTFVAPGVFVLSALALYLAQKNERMKRVEDHRKEREERAEGDRTAQAIRDASETRMHAAIWGYMEGNTRVPGIFEIVVGDGNGGSLSSIAKGARSAAIEAVSVAGETQKIVNAHVVSDDGRWLKVDLTLDTLSKGQADALLREAVVARMAIDAAAGVASTALDEAGRVAGTAKDAAAGVSNVALATAAELHRERS